MIASGGGGSAAHIAAAFREAGASAAMVSSLLYSPRLDRTFRVAELRAEPAQIDVTMRPRVESEGSLGTLAAKR